MSKSSSDTSPDRIDDLAREDVSPAELSRLIHKARLFKENNKTYSSPELDELLFMIEAFAAKDTSARRAKRANSAHQQNKGSSGLLSVAGRFRRSTGLQPGEKDLTKLVAPAIGSRGKLFASSSVSSSSDPPPQQSPKPVETTSFLIQVRDLETLDEGAIDEGVDFLAGTLATPPKESAYQEPILFSLLFDDRSVRPSEVHHPVIGVPSSTPGRTACTRVQDNKPLPGFQMSTLYVLDENDEFDRKTYFIAPMAEVFTVDIAKHDYLMWIVNHHKSEPGLCPYTLAFCYSKGEFIHWAELTPQGYNRWETKLTKPKDKQKWFNKDGQLDKAVTTKKLKKETGAKELTWVTPTPQISEFLKTIDYMKTKNLKELEIGIFVLSQDKPFPNIKDLIKNPATENFLLFLNAMLVPDTISSTDGIATIKWNDYTITFMVAPYMTKEKIRSKIGNAMCLIIFNDCETVFRPKDIFLGQVSSFVCVVQPVPEQTDYWRLGFFLHYETKVNEYPMESVCKAQETFVVETLSKFGPVIPAYFFFDKISLSQFILTKMFNGRLRAAQYHPQVKKLFEYPVSAQIQEFVQHQTKEKDN